MRKKRFRVIIPSDSQQVLLSYMSVATLNAMRNRYCFSEWFHSSDIVMVLFLS